MPCKDDKPEDVEITLFKAGSGYYLSAMPIFYKRNLKMSTKTVYF